MIDELQSTSPMSIELMFCIILGVAIPRKRAKLDISGNKGKTPTTSSLNDSRVSNFSTIPEDCEMEENGKSGDDPNQTPQRVNQHRRFDSSGAGGRLQFSP